MKYPHHDNSLYLWRRLRLLVLFIASMTGSLLQAQVSAPSGDSANSQSETETNSKAKGESVVVLSPFEVSAKDDKGYLAASSLSGSRTATSLKDIGTPMTAFTAQFMEDLGITDTAQLAEYMVSTEQNWGEQAGPQNSITTNDNVTLRMRGLPGGRSTINFFNADMRFDTFSLDRIDQSRGPNSILFGIGAPGGLINVTTKTAILSHTQTKLALTGRSWNGLREELDYNQPIIQDKLGIRFAAMNSNRDSWRNWEYDDQHRFFGTLKWKIDPKTDLNLTVEDGHVNKATKRSYTAYDAYTPWVEGGKQLSNTANAALGIQSLGGANYTVYDTATRTLQNWRLKTSSQRTTYGNIPIALTDFSILPRETVVYGPGNDQITDYTLVMGSLKRTFFDNISAELAAFQHREHRLVYNPNPNASLYLLVDTNQTLPNGQANPNAGRTYLESEPFIKDTDSPSDAIRLSLSYDFDLGRFGKHTFAVVGQTGHDEYNNITSGERILDNPYNTSKPENGQNRLRRRTYVDLNGPSKNIVLADWRDGPIKGLPVESAKANESRSSIDVGFVPFNAATQITSNTNQSVIVMLQSSFFKSRLHTVVGASRDFQDSYASSLARHDPFGPFANGILYAERGQTPEKFKADNVSFSGVYHLTDWVGVSYNQSVNASLPGGGILDTTNGRAPVPRGKSKDYGLRFNLLKNRIYITATYYETSATKNSAFNGVRAGDVNTIWLALDDAGVLAANGQKVEDVLSATTITTFDSSAEGFEFEMIANITDNWRLFANYNDSSIRETSIGEEMRAYIAKNRPFWEANANAPLTNPVGNATTVGGYLPILDQRVVQEFDLPDGGLQRGQALQNGNLQTTYSFSEGALDGVSVGGGMRYRGKAVTSYSASLDSSGKKVVNAIYRDPETYYSANFGYRGKNRIFGRDTSWSVQLNVNNLFNEDALIPLITTDTGSIVTYRIPKPREYVLTARLSF